MCVYIQIYLHTAHACREKLNKAQHIQGNILIYKLHIVLTWWKVNVPKGDSNHWPLDYRANTLPAELPGTQQSIEQTKVKPHPDHQLLNQVCECVYVCTYKYTYNCTCMPWETQQGTTHTGKYIDIQTTHCLNLMNCFQGGFEPSTYGLPGQRSNQLSYQENSFL